MKPFDGQYRDRKSLNAFQRRRRALLLLASLVFCILPRALADDHYAARNGQTPAGTYTTWDSAASNIQDAVDAATTNDTVWVGAGRYTVPPNATNYAGTNVVFINRPLTLRSSNSVPASTIIDGGGSNRGIALVYSLSTTNLFVVNGFTVSNCSATVTSALTDARCYGGGILFQPAISVTWTGVVQNCVISGNSIGPGATYDQGAGIYGGYNGSGKYFLLVTNCTIRGNSNSTGQGGGFYIASNGGGMLTDCLIENNWTKTHGGGMSIGLGLILIQNSVIRSNRSGSTAGGLYGVGGTSLLRNCLIHNNGNESALNACYGRIDVYNCTIVNNTGLGARMDNAGSVLNVYNSIAYSNSNGNLATDSRGTWSFTNNCSYPSNTVFLLSGTGNITNNPQFVDFAGQNYRLSRASPCINSGLNQAWMDGAKDLEGSPRVDRFSGRVDMGCYEHLSKGMMFKAR